MKFNFKLRHLIIFIMVVFGVLIRVLPSTIGQADADWWRAWMMGVDKYGPINIYSASEPRCNLGFLEAIEEKQLLEAPYYKKACQTVLNFKFDHYYRTLFPVVQPQFFYFDLYLTNKIRSFFQVDDYRAISILNTIYAAFCSVIFYFIAKKLKYRNPAIFSVFAVWLNPILILNGNIQLYKDLPLIFLISASLLFWVHGRAVLSLLVFGLSIVFKPTALFLMPFYFSVYRAKIIICALPFIATLAVHFFLGSATGYLVSIYSVTDTMGSGGAEGINLFKILDNFLDKKASNAISLVSIFLLLFASLKIRLKDQVNGDYSKIVMIIVAILFIRFGSQINHWLVVFPFVVLMFTKSLCNRIEALSILTLFFLQDLAYRETFRGSDVAIPGNYYGVLIMALSLVMCAIFLRYVFNLRHNQD